MAPKKGGRSKRKVKAEVTETEDEYAESELNLNEGQFEDVETDVDEGFDERFSDDEVEDEDKLDDNVEVEDEQEKPDYEEDDECFYKYAADTEDEYFEEEQVEELRSKKELKGDDRISRPVLFEDERIRILGDRTKQLSLSAKCLVKGTDDLPPLQRAELEIEHGVCPILIERDVCNGYYETWHVSELQR